MRVFYIVILILTCVSKLLAQNLILNPSFEDTLTRTTPLYLPADWIIPTTGSPDLMTPFNKNNRSAPQNFAGYQKANSGISYLGLLMYSLYANNDSKRFREYIQNELSDSLKKDSIYCLRIHISLADSSQYGSKGMLGVYFSEIAISSSNFFYLPYTPQIIVSPDDYITEKVNWLQFDYEYQARGGEQHITIGNFNDSNVVDTFFVGGSTDIVHKETYYYIDDVYLGHCDSLPEDTAIGLKEVGLNQKIVVYPNPVKDQLFILYEGHQKLQINLYNLVGQLVEFNKQEQSKQLQLSLGHLPKGIYLLEIVAGEERITKKIIKQ